MKAWIVRPTDPKTVGEIVVLAKEDARAIDEGRVFVGKKRARAASDPVRPGDEVRIARGEAALADVPILVQADDLVAVAKPAGIPTVPDHHGSTHALVAIVARMLKKTPADLRITSRLDREVSGAVVFALSDAAERRLKDARARGEYARRYVALAVASSSNEGAEDAERDVERADPVLHWTSDIDGKASSTDARIVARAKGANVAMLAVDPRTGRTHQIRIHASRAKMPLLGDAEYGGPKQIALANGRIVGLSRVALHAARVAVAGIVAEAPIPEELARVYRDLGGAPGDWERASRDGIARVTSRGSPPISRPPRSPETKTGRRSTRWRS